MNAAPIGLPLPGCRSGRPTASRTRGARLSFPVVGRPRLRSSSSATRLRALLLFGDSHQTFAEQNKLGRARPLNRRTRSLVEKRNLRRMPRKAFPIHVDTMPSIQVNGPVITMPDFTACMDDRITNHPLPFRAARRVGGRQPFKICVADALGMRTRNHHHLRSSSSTPGKCEACFRPHG